MTYWPCCQNSRPKHECRQRCCPHFEAQDEGYWFWLRAGNYFPVSPAVPVVMSDALG
jgi:hypothetical protein